MLTEGTQIQNAIQCIIPFYEMSRTDKSGQGQKIDCQGLVVGEMSEY